MVACAEPPGQNGRVTSAWPTVPEMLALRDTDPRQVSVYRLLGRLGEGGQGVVFLAERPTGSPAAVKLLPPTTDPQVRSRFLKEVAAAQRLARFCTAQVLDAGIFERRPFIVSEYVSGPSLVEVVEQFGPRGGACTRAHRRRHADRAGRGACRGDGASRLQAWQCPARARRARGDRLRPGGRSRDDHGLFWRGRDRNSGVHGP